MISHRARWRHRCWARLALGVVVAGLLVTGPVQARAEGTGPHDGQDATVWFQTSVEFKGHAVGAYKLAQVMLDRALADKTWTAVPEQTGDYQQKPPAVILDLDETVLDNSEYQVWAMKAGQSFDLKTWNPYVETATSKAIPGSLEFVKYAVSKGVAVFYISNRDAPTEAATRKNLLALGYPVADGEDTVLLRGERPEWKSSKKSPRRKLIADKYRVLLNIGDNLGDFTDDYSGSLAERQKVYEANASRWGTQWIVVSNPMYGSSISAPFGHNWKLPVEERRKMTREALSGWAGPK